MDQKGYLIKTGNHSFLKVGVEIFVENNALSPLSIYGM